MSEDRKEQMSAMMDGELDAVTIDPIINSPDFSDSWTRYHLISDSLQQQLPESIDTGLAARISSDIEKEPHLLAPVTELRAGYLKPVAGFAIAASVAVVAILGIQQNSTDSATEANVSVAFSSPVNPVIESQLPVAANSPTEAQLRQVKSDAQARMNSYLVNYSEYRTNAGLQGMLPYARTVTHENNR